jgi:Rps23 Pro-64 3,4-dihydroxylase Tpa1-like proline 4-hydroxylase
MKRRSVQSVVPLKSSVSMHRVTLLLTAGHEYHLSLHPDDPLLPQLFQIMVAKTQAVAPPPQLLQIPNGQAALCLSSADILGIVTEPALFVNANLKNISQPVPASIPTGIPATVSSNSIFLPAHFYQIDRFLSDEEHAIALQTALTQADQFIGSTTTTAADNYRQSAILYATLYPDLYHRLRQKIIDTLPSVLQQLQMPYFDITEVEMQMTAHNDGCFYKIHNDSGDVPTATRQLTYVYYFCQEPQAFSGGELKIYDTELKNGGQQERDRTQLVTPRNNSIVFFDSRLMHEVLPVSCPSRAFPDSRFTLNGWLRR